MRQPGTTLLPAARRSPCVASRPPLSTVGLSGNVQLMRQRPQKCSPLSPFAPRKVRTHPEPFAERKATMNCSTSGSFLDVLAPTFQQSPQVTGHEQRIDQPAYRAERRTEGHLVGHDRAAFACFEPVIVGERVERPADHLVPKMSRPLERGNLRSDPLAPAEVPGHP